MRRSLWLLTIYRVSNTPFNTSSGPISGRGRFGSPYYYVQNASWFRGAHKMKAASMPSGLPVMWITFVRYCIDFHMEKTHMPSISGITARHRDSFTTWWSKSNTYIFKHFILIPLMSSVSIGAVSSVPRYYQQQFITLYFDLGRWNRNPSNSILYHHII